MNETYTVCHQCAVVIANGDETGMDPAVYETVSANLDRIGAMLTNPVPLDTGVFYDCEVCEHTSIGDAYTVTAVPF